MYNLFVSISPLKKMQKFLIHDNNSFLWKEKYKNI